MSDTSVFGSFETPKFHMGQRVIYAHRRQICRVIGFVGWETPIVLYLINRANGDYDAELNSIWVPQSELKAE